MRDILKHLILSEVFVDKFDNGLGKWYQDTLELDSLHRTGNKHLDLAGNITPQEWSEVPGRWSALYNEHRDKCQFIRDGKLVMKGHAVKTPNPFRENFSAGGQHHRYGDYMLYTAWLSTWTRVFSQKHGERNITDFDNTTLMTGPGSVIQVKVNFENVKMRGHRWSFWMMPCTMEPDLDPNNPVELHEDAAYDVSTRNGIEVNFPEYENPERSGSDFGQRATIKYVGGHAGDTPNGTQNILEGYGIDLRKGDHVFTCLWHKNGAMDFYIDDVLVQHESRPVMTYNYLIMSREMNSGVKHGLSPYVPQDDGLTGQSVILDVDLIDGDEVLVDSVKVWSIDGITPLEAEEDELDQTVAIAPPIRDSKDDAIEKARKILEDALEELEQL